MTIQTLFSKSGTDMTGKYFLGELKRNWPRTVLYFIIFFMTMAIPLLIVAPFYPVHHALGISNSEYVRLCSERLYNYVTGVLPAWGFFSGIAALFSGCYVTKILNDKVSADFYHSVPLRREKLLLSRLAVGAISYLVTFFVNVLLFLFICEIQDILPEYSIAISIEIFKSFGLSVLLFFMIYSGCVFAGTLSGTTVMQLVVTAYLNFFPVVFYLALNATFFMGIQNINQSYYLSDSEFIWNLVPPFKLIAYTILDDFGAFDVVLYALLSIALIALSVVIYKSRKVERAGTPIVFDKFSSFFKYSVITVAIMLGGLFFESISGSFIWYLFGLAIGAILSFMLINTILAKNARRMFAGIKSFAIYFVITATVILLMVFDVCGLDNYVPYADSVKSATITYGNQVFKIKFEDEDVIKTVTDIDKKCIWNNNGPSAGLEPFYYSSTKTEYITDGIKESSEPQIYYISDHNSSYRLSVVYDLGLGISLARNVNAIDYEDLCVLLQKIADSKEFEEDMKNCIFEGEYDDWYIDKDIYGIEEFVNRDEEAKKPDKAMEAIGNNFVEVDYDFFQKQVLGYAHFYDYKSSGKVLEYPIFAGSELDDYITGGKSLDEFYESFAERIESIAIVKGNGIKRFSENGENTLIIRDKDEIKEVLSCIASFSGTRNSFTKVDPLYHIGIKYFDDEEDVNTFTGYFGYDKVPVFVSGSFE